MARTTDSSNRGLSLVGYLVAGALWVSLIGCFRGVLGDGGVAESAAVGALTGLPIGLSWYVEARRARRYRSSVDPDARSLRPPEPSAAAKPWHGSRRYRHSVGLRAFMMTSALIGSAVAVWATFAPDAAPAGIAVGLWGLAAVPVAFVWSLHMTFTEVGADGLVVRTPIRKQAIGWNELDFVRWQREESHDVLVFRTIDGREVKAAGVAVAATGQGERRMLRLRDAVQTAWAAGSALRQRRRLVIRLAEVLRARRAQMAPTECEVPGTMCARCPRAHSGAASGAGSATCRQSDDVAPSPLEQPVEGPVTKMGRFAF